jgi:hypothetical protein
MEVRNILQCVNLSILIRFIVTQLTYEIIISTSGCIITNGGNKDGNISWCNTCDDKPADIFQVEDNYCLDCWQIKPILILNPFCLLLLSYYFICPRSVTFNGCVPEAEGMGFQVCFFSSYDTDFNFERHVSFTLEELAKKEAFFNFTTQDPHISEREGVSVFL